MEEGEAGHEGVAPIAAWTGGATAECGACLRQARQRLWSAAGPVWSAPAALDFSGAGQGAGKRFTAEAPSR